MKRRNFVVASGSTLLSGITASHASQPSLGLDFQLSASNTRTDPSSVDKIIVNFDSIQITPRYLDESQEMNITVRAEFESGGLEEKTANDIPYQNGEKTKLTQILQSEDISQLLIQDGFDSTKSVLTGYITITVNHPDIIQNSYRKRFTVSNTIPDSLLPESLVFWHRFKQGDSRDYASDAELPDVNWGYPTAYNGTVNSAEYRSQNGVTDPITGEQGGYFYFSGHSSFGGDSADKIVGPDIKPTRSNPFTATAWVKVDTDWDTGYPDNMSPMCVRSLENAKWSVHYRQNSPQKVFQVYTDNNGDVKSDKYTNVIGGWTFIAVRDDGTSLYLTVGNSQYVDQDGGGTTFSGGSSEPFTIGATNGGGSDGEYWYGEIDDVRYYDKYLTDSQLESIRQNTKPD